MPARFLLTFLATLAILTGLTLALTLRVDSLGIYRNDTDAGLSRINQFWYMRTSKPLRLMRQEPRTLVFGSSRAGRLHLQGAEFDNAFNAALPGSSPYELRKMLEFSTRVTPADTFIIGLDFDAFLPFNRNARSGFNDALLDSNNAAQRKLHEVLALKKAFFSTRALFLTYLAANHKGDIAGNVYHYDGSWEKSAGLGFKPGDFSLLSVMKIREFDELHEPSLVMQEYTEILRSCHEQNLDCRLFTTPIHVFHLLVLEHSNLLSLWQEWHRQLVSINREVAAEYGRDPLPLWGFNTYAPAVTEAISTRAENADPWFKDPIHFRPKFGNLVLHTLLPGDGKGTPVGTPLTTETVDDYLQAVSRLKRRFVEQDAEIVLSMGQNIGLQLQERTGDLGKSQN